MVDKNLIFDNLNEGMLQERGRIFRLNLDKNMPLINRFGGLAGVIDRFSDKNVVIVGAGPSLDRSIPVLREIMKRQDLLIIASDMALRPLIVNGIMPHMAITCETTPLDYFSGLDTSSIHLIAFSCSSHGNVAKWKGAVSFYNWIMDGDFYESLWEKSGRELGAVATGSIVTTQAVSIALGCPVRTVVLVGNDLAFGRSYYASGTVSGERIMHSVNRLKSVETLNCEQSRRSVKYEIRRGDLSYFTNNQFLAAKMWLEDIFKNHGAQVIDCSVPGCSGNSVLKMDIRDWVKTLKNNRRRRRK